MRSIVLDWAEDDLEELEIRSGHRSTGNGDLMAAQTIQTILVAIVSGKRPKTSTNEYGDSQADPQGLSVLVEDAAHHHKGAGISQRRSPIS